MINAIETRWTIVINFINDNVNFSKKLLKDYYTEQT